jgi:outer membrane protein assembly factor BamB
MQSSFGLRSSWIAVGTALLFGILTAGFAADESYWPYWRGPAADGMAAGDAAVTWNDREHVLWKTDIPGLGNSSPVVWGNQVFLTTAIPAAGAGTGDLVENKFDVLSLDRNTGRVLWQRTAKTAVPHEGSHQTYGSFASNSPVTDGRHLFAFFGSRGVYCYDLNGNLVWQKDFSIQMRMKMSFGEGMAPVLAGNKLLLVFDHEGDSFMVALDKETGQEIWRVARDEKTNWAAPLVVDFGGKKQVVVAATRKVRSYDLENGALLWECAGLGANTIPQPVRLDDLVFVMSGYQNPKLMAIRLGRTGDLTGTDAIIWTKDKGNSYTPSPVIYDNKLYVLTDTGMLTCYDARTGEAYYAQQRLPKTYNFKSSPVGANGKLYLASENEDVIVVRMGEKFEVLATNTMPGETFIATPAITGGQLFLRSKKRIYCIQ